MFYNYNEEIKRQKERTIRSQNVLISTFCCRERNRKIIVLICRIWS
jgi:hypothetical protein